jgi:hypothetical protein
VNPGGPRLALLDLSGGVRVPATSLGLWGRADGGRPAISGAIEELALNTGGRLSSSDLQNVVRLAGCARGT